jgi:hypothetical protein
MIVAATLVAGTWLALPIPVVEAQHGNDTRAAPAPTASADAECYPLEGRGLIYVAIADEESGSRFRVLIDGEVVADDVAGTAFDDPLVFQWYDPGVHSVVVVWRDAGAEILDTEVTIDCPDPPPTTVPSSTTTPPTTTASPSTTTSSPDEWVDITLVTRAFPAENGAQIVCDVPCDGTSLERDRGEQVAFATFFTVKDEDGSGSWYRADPSVVVVDRLPPGVSLVSADVTEGGGPCTEMNGTVTCVVDFFLGDAEVLIIARVEGDAGVLTNTATASGVITSSGELLDPDLANNTGTADVIVAEPTTTPSPTTVVAGEALPETGPWSTTGGVLAVAVALTFAGVGMVLIVRRTTTKSHR